MDEKNPPEIPITLPEARNLWAKRKLALIVSGLVMVAILAIVIYRSDEGSFDFKAQYPEIYTLVNDKVSISAPILINLPSGQPKKNAEASIKFEPKLRGKWLDTAAENVVAFKPEESLESGKYYTVALATEEGEIRKDFQADEDPAVISILPKPGSEADAASSITIIFNRPMVPLTTLGELDGADIPVTITPPTKGKFKWISTRNLQFIPETTLISSANYSVSVNPGFVSMDGLEVAKSISNFVTRPLRSESAIGGSIRYNQPIELRFNQPIDLERTSREITLTNNSSGQSIPFIASYGSRLVYDPSSKKNKEEEDRSVLSIRPKKDSLGREGLWDFDNSYSVLVSRAYPVEGDINLDAPISVSVASTGVVQSILAKSERTTGLVTQELFDPQGSVEVNFYEDIDIERSRISVKGLKKIEYGEKCESGENDSYYYRAECKLVANRSAIIITFNDEALRTPGESVPIRLERIVNTEGLTLDTKEIVLDLKVYPPLKINKIFPAEGSSNGSITKLIICTNSPLKPLTGERFYDAVKADNYVVFGSWSPAYPQSTGYSNDNPRCSIGDYVNVINYGLLPDTKYSLSLSLEDVFGQGISQNLSFSTEKAPKFYLRFHSLNKIYNVTTPGKTKLTYAAENFDKVDVHICKVEPLTLVRYLDDRISNETPGQSLACSESKSASVVMPPKLWVNNYFQIDLADYFSDTRGQYVLTFSNPKYVNSEGKQQYERTYMSVTNLAVVEKRVQWTKYDITPEKTKGIVDEADPQGSLYWVSRIGDLSPVERATVSVVHDPGYANSVPAIASSGTTNASGIAKFPLIKDVVGATVSVGSETAIVSSWADTLNRAYSSYSGNRVYLYTDRPIYRPGQEVFIKGIYRWNFDGEYQFDTDVPVELTVIDSQGNEIYSKNATISKYGTFNASLKLPSDAKLGGYYIRAMDQYQYFSVEEYVGSAFEAKSEMEKEEYIAGEDAAIDVSGIYYFGVPVADGVVEYSLTAQNYYFDRYADEYFSFGGGWYGCYGCGYGDSYIKGGQAKLDSQGRARISQKLDFDSLFGENSRDSSKIVVFHATIKDAQGKSVSTQKSFIVHRGNYYLGVKADPYFAEVGQSFDLRLKTVDTKGKPVREGGIEYVINKVEWKSFKRQEVDGNYYSRIERVLTPVITRKAGTDSKGDYRESLKIDEPGEYEISATGTDDKGNKIIAKSFLYIYGEGSVSVRPTNNATLDITAEKTDLKLNDKAKIIFQSPYDRAKALITIERGRIFDYKVVDVNQNVYEHEFTIDSRFSPNVFASVLLLSSDPEVKFGQTQFNIDRKEKELNIALSTDKKSYLPGEKVSLSITTTDSSGKRVPAEVSVSVADLSVLALKGNPKKNPLIFFYNGFPLGINTASNVKNILTEAEIPTGTKGGDGANEDDLAKKQRGEFKDTAFWSAQVETNANGEAKVSFEIPDNLTKWQIESLGITMDTKVGVKYQEITAQKDIMLVPLRPRFVVPGDELEIGAQIFNQSDRAQDLTISYESETLGLTSGNKSEKRSIKARDSITVFWSVKAPLAQTSGKHSIVLSARNDEFDDSVRNEIPINSNVTYESVATANYTDDEKAREYIFIPEGVINDRGGVTIKASATLAVFLSDALNYLVQFPYGCSEQMASKLSSIAILKKGLGVKNVGDKFQIPPIVQDGNTYTLDEVVSIGLRKIYDAQSFDGGFSYYKGLPGNLYLTISVVSALGDLQAAGYAIDQKVLAKAKEYVVNTLTAKGIGYYGMDAYISGAYAMSKSGGDESAVATLTNSIRSGANAVYIKEKASSMTLGYLALLSVKYAWPKDFTDSVFNSLENRVDVDSRGAYVKSHTSNLVWQYYETPLKDTALYLKALSVGKRDNPIVDKLIRWILSSRSKDGAWGSTQNTLTVIDAFTEFLSWKRETESDFVLKVALDGKAIDKFDFNKDTVLSISEKFLPISSFETNRMHTIQFDKESRNSLANAFYYDMGLKYYLPAEQIPPRDEGILIERGIYKLNDTKEQKPIYEAKVGEVVKGKIKIITGKPRNLFAIEDFIPAGFELLNFNLDTEDSSMINREPGENNGYDYRDSQGKIYPDFSELHDDRLFLFKESLPSGEYTYEYYMRATTPGTFRYLPAVASELYFPENFGRTGGALFRVNK